MRNEDISSFFTPGSLNGRNPNRGQLIRLVQKLSYKFGFHYFRINQHLDPESRLVGFFFDNT